MEKKKLKKLELKKQVIVDLSENEARQIKGGTTAFACFSIAVSVITAVDGLAKGYSWWTCGPGEVAPEQPTGDNVIWNGDQGSCLIDQHNVYGLG